MAIGAENTREQAEKFVKMWPSVRDNPYLDVMSHVEATFSEDILTLLGIGKTESY